MYSYKNIVTINLIDFISDLPTELSIIIFLHLPPTYLLNCRRVSKAWKKIVENDNIWKSKFNDEKSWIYYNDDFETDSWYELYKERYLLDLNWRNDKFIQHKFSDPFSDVFCAKIFKNWILTGSQEGTIKVWDVETFQCLKVSGEPYISKIFSVKELLAFKEDLNIKSHSDIVSCMDINYKYLVSSSFDGSCIIWKLPDFKQMVRFKRPEDIYSSIRNNDVTINNEYIACCTGDGYIGDGYIVIWKSSFDNSEDQLQVHLQRRLKRNSIINGVCIHNGIIYSKGYNVITTWNIETGQIIQEFRYDALSCMIVNLKINTYTIK